MDRQRDASDVRAQMRGISAVGTLARYFSARFLIAMVAMFLICCVLIFFVDFIEMLRRAGNYSDDVPSFVLVWMTLLRLPSFSELVLPFAVLIGTIGIFLMLNRSSELVVLRAAGISVWQFTLPAMIVAFLLGVAFVLLYNPIAALARAKAEQLYATAFGRGESLLKTRNAGAWLREDGADGPTVVHAREALNQGLELQGVTVFQYDRNHGLTERIEAKRALLKDGRWELEDVWVSAVGQEPTFYQRYLLSTYLTPTQVRDSLGTVFSISFWDLPNFIQIAEKAGLPATQYRVQYQLLLSRPFLLVTMVLIAATCSLRGFRFGNVQINAVFGLAAGFLFFVFAEISRNFAMSGLTTAVAAAWVPVIVAASLALTVLLYREDG
jgi:lipopolysaccharide export system permease protein